jgi:tetratricopeptide (TPR) repeat protein
MSSIRHYIVHHASPIYYTRETTLLSMQVHLLDEFNIVNCLVTVSAVCDFVVLSIVNTFTRLDQRSFVNLGMTPQASQSLNNSVSNGRCLQIYYISPFLPKNFNNMPVENASPGPIKLEDAEDYNDDDSWGKQYNYHFPSKQRVMTADVADTRDIDGHRRRYLDRLLPDEMVGGIAGRSMWNRRNSESMGKHELEMLKGRTEDGPPSRGDPIRESPTTPGLDATLRCCNLARQLMKSGIGPCVPSLSMQYAEILIRTDQFFPAKAVLDDLPTDLNREDQCQMKRMRGVIHTGFGEYGEAHECFNEALELTGNDATIVKIECDTAAAYIKEGKYSNLQNFLDLSRNNYRLSDVDSFHFLTTLAEASYHSEEYKLARRYLEKAFDVSSRLEKQDSILNVNMAQILNKLGLCVEAMPLLEKSWDALRESFGLDHPYPFKCGVVLVETYFGMHMTEKASKTCEDVMRMQEMSDSPTEEFRETNMRLLKALAQGVVDNGANEKMW